jgi:hypothetical protein
VKLPGRTDPLELVRSALTGLRFDEGEVVQIARTEKFRTQRGPERG